MIVYEKVLLSEKYNRKHHIFSGDFHCSRKINYPPGIIYTGIGILMMILSFTVFRLDDELLQERAKPAENTQKWDKTILGLSSLAILAIYIIGGLDSGRFGWSHGFPDYSMIFGGILTAVGQLIFLIAQNKTGFFPALSEFRMKEDTTYVSRVCTES
jgi:hypothetical protein